MILEINLDRLSEGENSIEFSIEELHALKIEDYEVFFEDPLKVRIEKRGNYLHLTGSTEFDINLFCDRCTDEYAQKLEIDLDYVYHLGLYKGENSDQEIIEIPPKEHKFYIDNEVIEALELNIPFVKVCFEECKGLCTACGTNLNEETCECSTRKIIDPRWEKLAELAEKMKKENK